MDDLKNVRKRIKSRRYTTQPEEKHSPFSLFRILYHFVMLMMCVCAVVLVILLNQKLNLVKMPAVLENFKIEDYAKWLPFENWFSLKDEAVSATPSYTLLKDDQYSNGTNTAYTIYDAVVLHVQQGEDGRSVVTLKQDNGIISSYGNLKDVTIKQDERILKGKMLGTYDSYVVLTFLKDNAKTDLATALQNKA